MARKDEVTLTIHGLDVDGAIPRANVFVRKVSALIAALREADRLISGKTSDFHYLIEVGKGSARAKIRPKPARKASPDPEAAIATFRTAVVAIYNGDRTVGALPPRLVQKVRVIAEGSDRSFSHGELGFDDDNVIRIDDFLEQRVKEATKVVTSVAEKERYFRGVALGTFDGALQVIDSRGTMLRGKLTLSAGGIELDCVMNRDQIPEVTQKFEQRALVEALAHYDGESQLPRRLDVRSIKLVSTRPQLARWQGAFAPRQEVEDEEEW